MNIPLKQHLIIKMSSPSIGTSWFIKRISVNVFLSRVGILMQSQEEQPDEERMPVAVAALLQRVDELAAHHARMEECIGQIERDWEWECPRRSHHLFSLGSRWRLGKRNTLQEEQRRRERLTGRI